MNDSASLTSEPARSIDQELVDVRAELAGYRQRNEELTQVGYELIAQQMRLQALLHNAAVGMIALNPDGCVTSFNREAQRTFGYDEYEVLGCPIPHLIPCRPQDDGNVYAYLSEILRSQSIDDPVNACHRDGSPLMLQMFSGESETGAIEVFSDDWIGDADAEPVAAPTNSGRLICLFRDVTRDKTLQRQLRAQAAELERRQRQLEMLFRELNDSRDLYKDILENMQEVYYRTDAQGLLIMMSPSGAVLLGGAAPDQFWGCSLVDVLGLDDEDREAFEHELAKSGRVVAREVTVRSVAGIDLKVLINAHYYYDDAGRILGNEGLLTDLTAYRVARQAALREARRRAILGDLLAKSLNCMTESEFLVTSLETLLQQKELGLLGQGAILCWDEAASGWRPAVVRGLDEATVEQLSRLESGLPPMDLNGPQRVAAAKSLAGLEPDNQSTISIRIDGRVVGMIVLYTLAGHTLDLEERAFLDAAADLVASAIRRLRAEDAVRRHNQDLEDAVRVRTEELQAAIEFAQRASQAKSEFLANMSHELRTPLHAILSFAELGMKKRGGPDVEAKLNQYFKRIRESGSRLLFLLNDLLDLAKLEAGKMLPHLQRVDLLGVIEGCVAEQEAKLAEHGLTVEIQNVAADSRLDCDPMRISQVITNLLSNAIKFSADGGVIQVRLADGLMPDGEDSLTPASGLEVAVSDQGVGIPADELETIFDKFIQSSKTKSGAGGTGLGLSICRQIIETHGGKIWAESPKAGGASLRFLLPRAAVARE